MGLHQFVGPGAAVVVVVVMDPSVCESLRLRWSLDLATLVPAAAPRGLQPEPQNFPAVTEPPTDPNLFLICGSE